MIIFLSNISRLATSTVFWISLILMDGCYLFLAPRCATTLRQRSWVLSGLSSIAMSLLSLPLFIQFAASGGQVKHVSASPVFTDSVSRFFQAYLVADLTMGMLFYPSKLHLLGDWIHHTAYFFIVEYSVQYRMSHIFCLCTIMDISAIVFILGIMVPRLRFDALHAICFFTMRIVVHIALFVSVLVQRHEAANGYLGPAIILMCIFPLHVHWFLGSIKNCLKRANTAEDTASVAVIKLPANVASLPDRPSNSVSPPLSHSTSYYTPSGDAGMLGPAVALEVKRSAEQMQRHVQGGASSLRASLPVCVGETLA